MSENLFQPGMFGYDMIKSKCEKYVPKQDCPALKAEQQGKNFMAVINECRACWARIQKMQK